MPQATPTSGDYQRAWGLSSGVNTGWNPAFHGYPDQFPNPFNVSSMASAGPMAAPVIASAPNPTFSPSTVAPTSNLDRAVEWANHLTQTWGFAPQVSAGFIGAGPFAESAGFTATQERNPMIPGSRGGGGLGMWTDSRRRSLESFAAANNLDPNSYEAAVAFTDQELATTERRTAEKLANATTGVEGAQIAYKTYERPWASSSKATDAQNQAEFARRINDFTEPVLGAMQDEQSVLARNDFLAAPASYTADPNVIGIDPVVSAQYGVGQSADSPTAVASLGDLGTAVDASAQSAQSLDNLGTAVDAPQAIAATGLTIPTQPMPQAASGITVPLTPMPSMPMEPVAPSTDAPSALGSMSPDTLAPMGQAPAMQPSVATAIPAQASIASTDAGFVPSVASAPQQADFSTMAGLTPAPGTEAPTPVAPVAPPSASASVGPPPVSAPVAPPSASVPVADASPALSMAAPDPTLASAAQQAIDQLTSPAAMAPITGQEVAAGPVAPHVAASLPPGAENIPRVDVAPVAEAPISAPSPALPADAAAPIAAPNPETSIAAPAPMAEPPADPLAALSSPNPLSPVAPADPLDSVASSPDPLASVAPADPLASVSAATPLAPVAGIPNPLSPVSGAYDPLSSVSTQPAMTAALAAPDPLAGLSVPPASLAPESAPPASTLTSSLMAPVAASAVPAPPSMATTPTTLPSTAAPAYDAFDLNTPMSAAPAPLGPQVASEGGFLPAMPSLNLDGTPQLESPPPVSAPLAAPAAPFSVAPVTAPGESPLAAAAPTVPVSPNPTTADPFERALDTSLAPPMTSPITGAPIAAAPVTAAPIAASPAPVSPVTTIAAAPNPMATASPDMPSLFDAPAAPPAPEPISWGQIASNVFGSIPGVKTVGAVASGVGDVFGHLTSGLDAGPVQRAQAAATDIHTGSFDPGTFWSAYNSMPGAGYGPNDAMANFVAASHAMPNPTVGPAHIATVAPQTAQQAQNVHPGVPNPLSALFGMFGMPGIPGAMGGGAGVGGVSSGYGGSGGFGGLSGGVGYGGAGFASPAAGGGVRGPLGGYI